MFLESFVLWYLLCLFMLFLLLSMLGFESSYLLVISFHLCVQGKFVVSFFWRVNWLIFFFCFLFQCQGNWEVQQDWFYLHMNEMIFEGIMENISVFGLQARWVHSQILQLFFCIQKCQTLKWQHNCLAQYAPIAPGKVELYSWENSIL